MILETINGPEDIKHLDRQELETLAQEIREFLIDKIWPPIWAWWS